MVDAIIVGVITYCVAGILWAWIEFRYFKP
jgi:hypothetical protein